MREARRRDEGLARVLLLATSAIACTDGDGGRGTPADGLEAAADAGGAQATDAGARPLAEGGAPDATPGAAVVGVAEVGARGGVGGASGGVGGAGAVGGAGEPVGPITCDAWCTPIFANPVDATRGCVMVADDPPPEWAVACECGGAALPGPECLRRRSDGSPWLFAGAAIVDDDAWQPCTPEQEAASVRPCNFLHCERPPFSLCTREATCVLRDCGGFEYDEQGCLRPTCSSDADCTGGNTCVTGCSENAMCRGFPGNCSCARVPSAAGCAMVSTCSPVPAPPPP